MTGRRTNRRKASPVPTRTRIQGAALGVLRFLGRLFLAVMVVGGVFGAVIGIYVWTTTTPRFAVREVRIEGNRRASLDELAPLTGLRAGTSIFLVDLDEAVRGLESHPWVRRADARREFPGRIQVSLEEHTPLAMVSLGALYLVDEAAQPFKRVQPGDSLDLPIITGIDEEAAARGEAPALLAPALAFLDLWSRSTLSKTVELSEIHMSPVRGLAVTLVRKDGETPPVVTHLGRDDHARRLVRLDQLWTLLSGRGEHPKEVFLDNRTRPQWVVARVD